MFRLVVWCFPEVGVNRSEAAYLLLNFIQTQVVGGCILAGPPCSLFIFVSQSLHCRSAMNPFGDQQQSLVREANQIAINLVVLLAVAHSRKIYFLLLD